MTSSTAVRISAIFGVLAVAFGAFGAHGLEKLLAENGTTAIWNTAAHYHLVHAVVLLVVSAFGASRNGVGESMNLLAWRLFAFGILIFSGSLYLLAVTNVRILGAITPIGGILLLGGWLALAWRGLR